MVWIGKTIDSIKSIKMRHLLTQAKSFGMMLACVLIIWKTIICVSGSQIPGTVVISGSMEPGFQRGDMLFLQMSKKPIRVGEIVVFKVDGGDLPIVHRVIKVHERRDTGEAYLLTKGDNNLVDDRALYAKGQLWLHRDHIIGRAFWFLPYAGWLPMIVSENPIIKYILIGATALLWITSKN